MIVNTADRQTADFGQQLVGAAETQPGVEDHHLGLQEMKLLVGPCPGNQLAFVEPLLHHFDEFLAEKLQIIEVRGGNDAEPFREGLVVQSVVGPGRKVVVVFRLVELGAQQASPEMMVDAVDRHLLQSVAQLTQVLGLAAGGQGNQGAVLNDKGNGIDGKLTRGHQWLLVRMNE